MTPEKAHELLQSAQTGPWEYKYPLVETEGGRGQLTAADPGYGVIDAGDGPLVAAAPELAQLVAGMTYEYTVYVYLGERHIIQWSFEEDSHVGEWTDDLDKATYVRDALIKEGRQARLVRRLTTDPEVVE